MKRSSVVTAFIFCCGISSLGGYWAGCREGWRLGVAADSLPRGALAVAMLKDLKSNKQDRVVTLLEFDVDNALIWGKTILDLPLGQALNLFAGMPVIPDFEQYVTRAADYRREHPTLMNPDAFDTSAAQSEFKRKFNLEIQENARKNLLTILEMVDRYGTKK